MQLSNAPGCRDFIIHDLGLVPYREVWALQKAAQAALIAGTGDEQVFLCEHPAVITIGRSGSITNLRYAASELMQRGIEVIPIERGGDITFHGPGQLVVYPILDLRTRRQDVGWYLRTLEQVIIATLLEFGIFGLRYSGRTGVWTHLPTAETPRAKKIASIGIRLSRWCTLHGISLNVTNLDSGFRLINPCGFDDIDITSVSDEVSLTPPMATVKQVFIKNFRAQLGLQAVKSTVLSGEPIGNSNPCAAVLDTGPTAEIDNQPQIF